jgi:hypothetical protein
VSSASRPSASVVNPTRSAKRIDTNLSSAVAGSVWGGTAWSRATLGIAAPRAAPQSPQNRLPGSNGAPQVGQPVGREAPQSPQNRLPGGFSVPQLPQTTTRTPNGRTHREYTSGPGLRDTDATIRS